MADIKLGDNTYEGVDAVELNTTDGGTAMFYSESGGGLTVVTIASQSDSEYEFVDLTEEEAAQMEAVANAGTPLIIRMTSVQSVVASALCYEWIVSEGVDGMAGEYIAKCDGIGMGYLVIRKTNFTSPWQIAWGADLSRMLM